MASGIIDEVTSSGSEHLARTAYEAHREAQPRPLPPWEEVTQQEQQAWRAAVSAVAAQTGSTVVEKMWVLMMCNEGGGGGAG